MTVRNRITMPTPHAGERRRFKLTETLNATAGDDAAVRWVAWTPPGDDSGAYALLDSDATDKVYNGKVRFSGTADTYGMAEWWPDSQRWEIYQLDCEPA